MCYIAVILLWWLTVMFNWSVRVYYEDTDAGGIVYYANYLKFMERARTEWLRSLGIEQTDLLEQEIGFVVKSVQMDNNSPARFNDLLCISSQIVELKRASIVFRQSIYKESIHKQVAEKDAIQNETNNKLVEALIRVACVDLNKMKPLAIPKTILGELERVV